MTALSCSGTQTIGDYLGNTRHKTLGVMPDPNTASHTCNCTLVHIWRKFTAGKALTGMLVGGGRKMENIFN